MDKPSLLVPVAVLVGLLSVVAWAPDTHAQPNYNIIFQDNGDFRLSEGEYNRIIVETAIAISPTILAPAETLGVHGFDFGVEANTAFIHSGKEYWAKAMSESESPPFMLAYPTVRIRKGFLFSTELETSISTIPFSDQNVISGGGRFALHEGFELVPDVTFGLNYSWMFGNPYLELGVTQWHVAIGYTWPVGRMENIKVARVSPYIAYGQLYVRSKLLAVRQGDVFTRDISGFATFAGLPADGTKKLKRRRDPRPDKWVVGVQGHSGRVSVNTSVTLIDYGIPTFNVRVGTTF